MTSSNAKTILAIESSCDETAVAIVQDGRHVLCNIINSQAKLHEKYGGVVPEAAAREHISAINACLDEALLEAKMSINEVDAFAGTLGPGLVGSLLIGANTAKTLSVITGKPFLGINHLYAHVASNYLDSDLEPPFLCLLVSGGHTQLIHVKSYTEMKIIGETLDDAVGEAYDKVARIMGLPYPGGPNMDKLAQTGNPKAYTLPKATTKKPFDFSFSGLKTASQRTFETAIAENPDNAEQIKADMAASFQHTVVTTLFKKTKACADELGIKTMAIAGGVSANKGLRAHFQDFVENNPEYRLFIPKMSYCTDNAAMVGASAFFNPITEDIKQEVFSRA